MVPGGGLRSVPNISPDDVGEIAAQAVLRENLGGKRFRMTGPEALSFPEATERISKLTGKNIKHKKIPLTIINIASAVLLPFNPFIRFLYRSLKMLNNFPSDLAENVPEDHKILRDTFDYTPVTFDMEVRKRYQIDN
jgi:uncharacterized protein YbjT (DUF2867 family)